MLSHAVGGVFRPSAPCGIVWKTHGVGRYCRVPQDASLFGNNHLCDGGAVGRLAQQCRIATDSYLRRKPAWVPEQLGQFFRDGAMLFWTVWIAGKSVAVDH